MSDTRAMLNALSEPFPPQAIEKREGAYGRSLDYVATETVIRRLNNTVGVWDFRITGHEWRPPISYIDKKQQERTEQTLVVWGEMTIPGLGTRSGTGVQVVEITRGNEDMMKGAASDCLKKCATQFGVGIDLYGPDLEAGELVQQPVTFASTRGLHQHQIDQQNNVPPRARNTSQNTVAPQQAPTSINQQPQPNGNQAPPQARAGLPPTPRQFGMIGGLRDRMGWTDAHLHAFAGVDSLNDLDRADVSGLIDALMQKERTGDIAPPKLELPRDIASAAELENHEAAGGGNFDDVPF